MFHLIRNVNYLCIVCTVVVCLFGLEESCDRDQGGVWVCVCVCVCVCVSLTLELFASSLPSAVSLSHLALKWRNVFKASSNFTGALTTSSYADVAVCGVYVCVRAVCWRGWRACECFLGHSTLLFLENPLDGEMCCLKSHIYCQNKKKKVDAKVNNRKNKN